LATVAPVAVITGRSLADIRDRLGFEPHFIVGNHGLEGVPGWEHDAERHRQLCGQWLRTLTAALTDHTIFDPGIRIESKAYSISVHYRLARNKSKAEMQLAELFGKLEPPVRVMAGKCVFNLLPQDAADKGVALQKLMQLSGAASAIYVGDDVTDEDVFRLNRREVLTVRIGYANDSAAEFYLRHRLQMFRLLDELNSRLLEQFQSDREGSEAACRVDRR
jgi:trehalose 6-phosphate phosphatase